jgi:hypothetical protein
MSVLNDVMYAIPIGIMFNIIIYKLLEIIYKESTYEERYQYMATSSFIAGIIGLAVAEAIFARKGFIGNRAVRFGLIGGSALLIFYTIVANWDKLDDMTKLTIFGMAFAVFVWLSYNSKSSKSKIKE